MASTSASKATAIVARWKRRLPKTCSGYSAAQVDDAERRLGVVFPEIFREYLLQIGTPTNELFVGSRLPQIDEFLEFRQDAREQVAELESRATLPPEAVVFLYHQGYVFSYILARGGFDSPVMYWTEGDPEPHLEAASFVERVKSELHECRLGDLRDDAPVYFLVLLGLTVCFMVGLHFLPWS